MRRVLSAVVVALSVLYPLLVYGGLTFLEPRVIGGLLLALLALRVMAMPRLSWDALLQLLPSLGAVLVISVLVMGTNHPTLLLLYPVLLNLTLLVTFGRTLAKGPPMIERFARLQEPELDEAAQRYCRKVTFVWCGFFAINALVALWLTLFHSVAVWTFYNGFVSYLLIGLLVGGEWLYRKWKLEPARKARQASRSSSIPAVKSHKEAAPL